MAEIDETELPGIGVRREFTTRDGTRLGVITNRTGRRDLLLYDRDDPDVCRSVVPLDERDSDVLADLLGAARVVGDAASTLHQPRGTGHRLGGHRCPLAGARVGPSARRRSARPPAPASPRCCTGGESVPNPGPDTVLPAGGAGRGGGQPRGRRRDLAELLGA